MWYTQDGSWGVQTCFFGGLLEFWTPERQFGNLTEMKGIGIERKPSKGEAIKGMLGMFSTMLPLRSGLMTRSSWPHVDLVTDEQTAVTALPLLDQRKLIGPIESHLNGIASHLYWNIVMPLTA